MLQDVTRLCSLQIHGSNISSQKTCIFQRMELFVKYPPMKVKGLKSFCMIACNGLINLKFKDIRLPNRKYRPEIDFHTIYQKIYKTIHREGKCCNNEE